MKLQGSRDSISKRIYSLFTQYRNFTLLGIIVIFILVFSILYSKIFPTYYNISAVLLAMSTECIIVIGMAIMLICGEIDLSVGFNMSLAGIICTHLIVHEKQSILIAFALTMIVSVIMGLINGLLVARVGVNSFITTLATGLVYSGVSLILTNGTTITHLPASFNVIGQATFFGLQIPVWYAFALVVIFTYLVGRTKAFRQYYYIGSNKKAAALSGINVRKWKIIAFIITSLLASFAGIISAARFGNAAALVGSGMELKVITAAVIGGVSFMGGIGTILGAVLGTIFMALVNNGMIIAEVNQYWQQIIVGLIMLFAVILDVVLSRKRI